ncbi:MAG: hypothetical protein QOJ50_2478 [Cryptosporangiaceae bacterium]|nr:hypothetical protein [Cryptosporangiaceae bacterium]
MVTTLRASISLVVVLGMAAAVLAGLQPGLASAVTVAIAALVAAAVVVCRPVAPRAAPVTSAGLRRRSPGTGLIRQHDPAAAGRPRTRAPSPA